VRRDREEVTNDRNNPRNDAEWLRWAAVVNLNSTAFAGV
jgi:hypothetical protein